MQTDNIIEKAKKLGLDTGSSSSMADNLRHIAEQVGINDFNSITDVDKLEQVLDTRLNEQNNSSGEQDISQNQDINSQDNFNSNQKEAVQNNRGRFGEREYQEAKKENGSFDKNYYKAKQKELDQKLSDAKKEKKYNDKKVGVDENGHNKYKKKNVADKAKDRVNVAKARQDAISNKLAGAKANAYKVMHPGEALKDAAKGKAKDVAKSAGKKVGKAAAKTGKAAAKATAKAAKAVGKAIIKFIASNPYVLAIIGVIALILLIIILIMGGSSSNGGYAYGIYGYEYIEPKCTEITITNGDYAGTYQLEEYIAGVVEGEFGVFVGGSRNEAAKAGAIAARSFVQASVSSDCKIESSEARQVYSSPSDGSIQVAEETRGIVLVENGQIKLAQYDAFCTDSPQDDPDNYIVCQKNQLIPRSWVDSQSGIAASWKNGTRSGAHGNGMSAWGAAYLAEVENYTFEQILEYYYDEAELMSVYPSFDVSSNYTYEINLSSSSSIQVQIAHTPLRTLLSETAYNELSDLIYDSVLDAGLGSRDAVVASAVTPIKYLAENYGVLIPYTLSGGHYATINNSSGVNVNKTTTSYYGVDPDWGTPINYSYYYEGSWCYYDSYGPDCSSFVPWVFHNAGFNMAVGKAGSFVNYGEKENLCGSYTGKPGDLIESSGHITVIVGVDESASKYYIAHASGGSEGVKISTVSFCDTSGYYIVNMDNYYSNSSNLNANYENAYESGVLSYK